MIEVRNLVKKYGNHVAIDNLSFHVEKGKVVGFLGPNGAGKSTTMNIITGYIAPSQGEVLINGKDIVKEPDKAKQMIGYLPEIPPLYQDMRVREYLQFVAQLKKVPKKEVKIAIHDVMKKTKITDNAERLIRHLSKGYRQRVGFAGAMLGNPDILILDEPTVGLDPNQIIEIRELIRDLKKTHTIFLSSHILQEISAICDEIIIMNKGKMIACDTPEHLTQRILQNNVLQITVKANKEEIENAIKNIIEIEKVVYELSEEKDCVDVTIYTKIENDIREKIFYLMAEKRYTIMKMLTLHSTLEEAFLALTKEDVSTENKEISQKEEK